MIKVGDRLPEATFKTMSAEGPKDVTTTDVFKGKTVVLFAVPGAFTPTCHRNHMPSYVQNAAAIKAKGVDAIAVTAVNDVFVMSEWAKVSGAEGKLDWVLADGSAQFAKAIGLDSDLTARGMGVRSMRYSMLVKDGKVASLHVEATPGTADESGAAKMLAEL
jgi:peroxiredoxin